MQMELSVPKQIAFLCALYDVAPESLVPNSIWESIKHNFNQNEEDSTGNPLNLTDFERQLLKDCFEMLYIKIKTIDSFVLVSHENNAEPPLNPKASCMERECRIFIGCFNSYLSRLEGKCLPKYGEIKPDELKIVSVKAFSDILQQAVFLEFLSKNLKKVANSFLNIMVK